MNSFFRYQGSSIVDFDSLRGGISLETEKTDTGTTSRLMLTRASLRDSGNYTCMPTGAIPASVRVHVLTGKYKCSKYFIRNITAWLDYYRRTTRRDANQ